MKNLIFQFLRRFLVKPSAISRWIGKSGYALHAMANNYNFDMETNGEKALMQALAPHGVKTVLDVGAYKGHWSACALPIFTPVTIHAFEPVPRSFGKLTRNMGTEDQCHLHQLALGAEPATIQIAFNKEKPTRSGFHARTMKYDGIEIIDVTVIDGATFCKEQNIATIDMLKIDAEGHEKHVLHGFEPMLKSQSIRAIQFEYSPVGTIYDVSLWELYELFERNGYIVGKVFPEGIAFAPFDSLEETILGPNYCAISLKEHAMIKSAHAPARTNKAYVSDNGGPVLG